MNRFVWSGAVDLCNLVTWAQTGEGRAGLNINSYKAEMEG